MKARVHMLPLIPPGKGIGYVLRIGAKITIELITKLRFERGRKGREIVEDIL
jgi:hypothetical protein